MLIWAAKVDFIETVWNAEMAVIRHTSHLFGTYCRSLWCLTKTTGVWRQVTEQDVIAKPMFWYNVSVHVQSTYVLTHCVSTSTVNLCSDILCHLPVQSSQDIRLPIDPPSTTPGQLLHNNSELCVCVRARAWKLVLALGKHAVLEDGTDRLFRNVGSTNQRCVTSKKSAGLQNYIYKATAL